MSTPRNVARSIASTSPSSAQGLARNPSLRGRTVRKSVPKASLDGTSDLETDNAASSSAQLIADLKEQLERAEHASDQYRKQLEMVQERLDKAADQQTAAEEQDFAAKTRIDKLMAEAKENARLKREMEINFESERNLFTQEKERADARDAELQSVINRLTQNLKLKSLERASSAKLGQGEADSESSDLHSTNSPDNELLQMLQEKDAAIDTLKLELADFHIKVAEQEHMGDGRLQNLEKQLSDIKMQNARLVEENDSFQMLLSEKTLKGDFLHDAHSEAGGMTSLAEELESIGEMDDATADRYRKLEMELKNVREEKKALTLYIDKIIGKVLQHEGFEHIITGKDSGGDAAGPMPPPKRQSREKPLPLAPAANVGDVSVSAPDTPTMMGGFLQRARSVVARGAPARPSRPTSLMQAQPTANENPETAPSIPLNKGGHRRARSDQMHPPDLGGAPTAQFTNKGSPLRTASGSPMNSAISPLGRSQGSSYFAPPARSETARVTSSSGAAEPSTTSSANSVTSGESYERQSTEATSAQASVHARDPQRDSMGPPFTAGVMKQNQLRPLRLVQNQDAEEEARKKANRQTWMGNWFVKPTNDVQTQ